MTLDLFRAQERQAFVVSGAAGTVGVTDDLEHRNIDVLHHFAQGGQLGFLVIGQRGAVKAKGNLHIDLIRAVDLGIGGGRRGGDTGRLARLGLLSRRDDDKTTGLLLLESFCNLLGRHFVGGLRKGRGRRSQRDGGGQRTGDKVAKTDHRSLAPFIHMGYVKTLYRGSWYDNVYCISDLGHFR